MSAFLDALSGRPTSHTPIWLMRQAGRYQESYRAIRAKVDFLGLCKTPALACQVTVDAVEQLGVDAAIIFADILLILEPLQIGFHFEKDMGPKIEVPIRSAAQIEAIPEDFDPASLGYVMEAIRLARRALKVPLIGFSAAPFTLASYAIEGKGSRNYHETKKLMLSDPALFSALMSRLAGALSKYLLAQIEAGAQVIQLFDSWVGCLSPHDYEVHVAPHTRAIVEAIGGRVPVIHFGTGNPELLCAMREAGGDMIGVDWRIPHSDAWARLGEGSRVMGNMDPAHLLAPIPVMQAEADRILEQAKGRPGHVFNLGHGIMPETTVDQVRALVLHVQEASQRP